MKQPLVKNSEMLEYANDWVRWYESDRKRTARLFRETLLKMDKQKAFDLNEYNQLVDQSDERDETRTDAKKMARVLVNSWVLRADEEELNQFTHRANAYRKNVSSRNGERLVRANENDGVKF